MSFGVVSADLSAGLRRRLDRLPGPLARARYDASLLVGRGIVLFVIVDLLVVGGGAIEAISASSGFTQATALYRRVVLVPFVLLGVPALSGLLAIERRSGSLDLALSTRSVEAYLLRRAVPVPLFLALQGVAIVWLLPAGVVPRLGATVLAVILAALTVVVVLFWAARLQTSGAVLVASALTLGLLYPWAFFSPFPSRGSITVLFFGIPWPLLLYTWNLVVLVGVTVLLYLYSRRRLRRPEMML